MVSHNLGQHIISFPHIMPGELLTVDVYKDKLTSTSGTRLQYLFLRSTSMVMSTADKLAEMPVQDNLAVILGPELNCVCTVVCHQVSLGRTGTETPENLVEVTAYWETNGPINVF